MKVLDALKNLHWEELSPEQRAARQEAAFAERCAAAHLVGMKDELVGVVARLQRAEAEKIRLLAIDPSSFNGEQRVEHATALAVGNEAVITLTERVKHIEQQIRKAS